MESVWKTWAPGCNYSYDLPAVMPLLWHRINVISIYSANCSNQFLWQMYLNPIGLGATFLAILKLYGVMSDGKSGQGKGGIGPDQNNP